MSLFRPLLLSAACGLALAAGAASAQTAAPAAGGSLIASTRIATVNVQGIMRDSTAAKSVRDQLESKQKTYQAEISKKEDALQKEQEDLTKQQSVLSKEAFDEKVKAFRARATTAQKEVQEKKAVLDGAFERSVAQIQKAVTDIIGELAKEKGFVIALSTTQILYADGSMDISAEVLSRLNQRLPHLDVKFDAPAPAPAAGAKP